MAIQTKDAKDIVVDHMVDYATYVAISRAIPGLLDGFKPVQRRIIASARDLGIWSNRQTLKSAKVAGEVLGNYHPHGDAYGPLVGMTQPFKLRYPLFEGQGNWGSADLPGSVAAPRYTEVRLSKFSEEFYLNDADYGDYGENYDGRLKELTMMYPVLPGSLLTGASGIAVGLSTSIPTHTIKDLSQSILSYIEDPTDEKYIDLIMPESVEKSIIVTPKSEIRKLYTTGQGSIRYKARTHYEVIDGKPALVVDSFPPGYSKKALQSNAIVAYAEEGSLEVLNESKVDIRYVFIAKNKEILQEIEDKLYKSVGYRLFIDHRGVIKLYTLGEIYRTFIEERMGFILRKYSDLLIKSQYEHDYLDVLYRLKNDKSYIKDMFDKSSDVVIQDIVSRYSTTQKIAARVISASLRSLMADNQAEILSGIQKRKDEILEFQRYINDPLVKVKSDIEELLKSYLTEERRAIHETDISSTAEVTYKGKKLRLQESNQYVIATPNNQISLALGSELIRRDGNLDSLVSILPTDKKYYIAYDERGITGMEGSVLVSSGNKFKSDSLVGLIGVNDLSKVELILGNGKSQKLGDWVLRKRASWQRMSDDDQNPIKVVLK